jgi:hypothetical protein
VEFRCVRVQKNKAQFDRQPERRFLKIAAGVATATQVKFFRSAARR